MLWTDRHRPPVVASPSAEGSGRYADRMPEQLDLTASSIDITRAVCDIESVSGNEGPLADAIEAALSSLPHLDVVRDGDAIVARTQLGRERRVVIAGHIDTVPLNGNLPTEFRTADDGTEILWGRGTVDMKAGCAVQLKLAHDLTEPNVDVTWVFYDHEEVSDSLNGLGRLARTRPELLAGDFAILGEPSGPRSRAGATATSAPRSGPPASAPTAHAAGSATTRSTRPHRSWRRSRRTNRAP